MNMLNIQDHMYSHFKCKANDICTLGSLNYESVYSVYDTIK